MRALKSGYSLPEFDALGADTISFYSNGADTETKGFDLVLIWGLEHSGGSSTDISFAFNHNETDVSNLAVVDPNCGCAKAGQDIIGGQGVFNIEENLPNDRASISVAHFRDNWQFTFRSNWYGEAFDEREFPNKNDTRIGNGLEYSRRTSFAYDGGMAYLKVMYDF